MTDKKEKDLKKLNEMISEFETDIHLNADKRMQLYLLVYRSFLFGAQGDGVSAIAIKTLDDWRRKMLR